MTELAHGLSQSLDNSTSSQPSPVSTPPTSPAPEPREERTFRQAEVTDIVRRERQEAVDKYRRLQSEQPQYAAQKYGTVDGTSAPQQQPHTPSSGHFDENRYRSIAAEEAQRLRDQWVQDAHNKHQEELAQRTVQNFYAKVQQGREKFEDFDKVTGQIEYASFPNVVQLLADHVENASDVMYELGKDLAKMEVLESMAMRSPKAAILQAQRLAESLKANEQAANVKLPRAPLSQMRPSNTGMDSGVMSVKDFRNKYKG